MIRIFFSPFLLFVGLTLGGCAASKISPKGQYQKSQAAPVDVIIVPGAPFNGVQLDSILKGRIIWAYILWKNGITKNVIFSGGAVYTPFFESKVMGAYAQEYGIPEENIFYDTVAEHSTENVYFSYLLAKKLGFKTIALATDPVQAFTLNAYLKRRFATTVQQLPFIIDSISRYNHLQYTIARKPLHISAWTSITRRESFVKRFMGTLGRQIPWHRYPDGRVPEL